MTRPPVRFSTNFDRAVAACARAQVLSTRAVEAAARARATRKSAIHIRQHAVETREAWKGADRINNLLRTHVTSAAEAMRTAGMTKVAAAAAVRAHLRFVLYDGGLREVEAEPIVERATSWVEETFRAA
ncbi:MAG: hypothetical protein JWN79_2709 [Gemmatimonadetes bacterium]|nr:hypothetical protein [Gemmatimonadota bacterium]